MTWFSYLFLGLIILNCGLKLYLNNRQIHAIKDGATQVPQDFITKINLNQHQKAANYNLAKLALNQIDTILNTVLILIFSFGGGLNLISRLINLPNYPISQNVLIIISYGLISSIISLPLSLYSTFYIEEKFGFNKMTLTLFIIDLIKSLIITLILGMALLYLLIYFLQSFNNSWWILAWITLIAFNFLVMLIYPSLIAPLFNKFSPLNNDILKHKISNLLNTCKFKASGIFIMDGSKRSSHGNAYFTGLGKSRRIVFFDTLLNQLNHEEIVAVLAHELGHFKHKHIIKQLLFMAILSLIAFWIMSILINAPWFYLSLNVIHQSYANGLILASLLLGLLSLPFAPLMSFLSRKNEFAADKYAKENANYQNLINALVKLYCDNASTLTPDPWYVMFYYSHPTASIRIQELCNRD